MFNVCNGNRYYLKNLDAKSVLNKVKNEGHDFLLNFFLGREILLEKFGDFFCVDYEFMLSFFSMLNMDMKFGGSSLK